MKKLLFIIGMCLSINASAVTFHAIKDGEIYGEFLFIGFEDFMGGGDLDFDDNNAFFTNISAVPEPEPYMMFLVALLLITLGMKREIS